ASSAESLREDTRAAYRNGRRARALGFRGDRVSHSAESEHLHFYHIPGREFPDSRRAAREHEVAGLQRHDVRDVSQHVWNRENHVRALASLAFYAIHPRYDGEASQVRRSGRDRTNRAERIESLGACPLRVN